MSVRKFKPTTPGQRHKIINGFDAITVKNRKKCKFKLAKYAKQAGTKAPFPLIMPLTF